MKTLFAIAFILLSLFAEAKEVQINGNAGTYYHGQNIYLLKIEESLFGSKSVWQKSIVSLTGAFSFSVSTEEIHAVELLSAFVSFPFRVQPNGKYQVEIENPKPTDYVSIGNKAIKDVVFFGLQRQDINAQIMLFNTAFDSLIDSELNNFSAARLSKKLKQFYLQYDTKKGYLKEYAQSAIARQLLNFAPEEKSFYAQYVAGKSFDLSNTESTNLLSKFYDNAVNRLLRFEGAEQRKKIRSGDAQAFYNLFKSWDFCSEPQHLLFAAVHNAYTEYNNQNFDKDDLMLILNLLEKKDEQKHITPIISSIKKELGIHFQATLDAFLKSINAKTSSKPTILCFYQNASSISVRELYDLEQIIKNSALELNVLKICTDCDSEIAKASVGKSIHNLQMDPMVFDSLRLYSLPKFTMVDANGILIKEWLEPPSHGAETQIKSILMRLGRP